MSRRHWLRHLVSSPMVVKKYFSDHALRTIESAIGDSEKRHSGEVRFVVEAGLELRELIAGLAPRAKAIRHFSDLGVWDTEENNGVLLYLLLADRTIEIVADRGADAKVGRTRWAEICRMIEQSFAEGKYERGVLDALELITVELAKHYPPKPGDKNELPDGPVRI